MSSAPMKKELPPAAIAAALVVLVIAIAFAFWYLGKPPGVTTKTPPKPNPPGGAIVVQ